VELFEQMRREYEHGEGTIMGVARKFGVHRRNGTAVLSQRGATRAEAIGATAAEARAGPGLHR